MMSLGPGQPPASGGFWAATYLSPRSPSSMSLEQLGLDGLLSKLSHLKTIAELEFT